MSYLARKPLNDYAMDEADGLRSRPKETTAGDYLRTTTSSEKVLRSSSSPSKGNQRRSTSPKKQNLYPDLQNVEREFLPGNFDRVTGSQPIDGYFPGDPDWVEEPEEPPRYESSSGRIYNNNPINNINPLDIPAVRLPSPKPVKRTDACVDLTDKSSVWTLLNSPSFLVPMLMLILAVLLCFIKWYNYLPTVDELALDQFERKFNNFTREFKRELHHDSLRILHNALYHHVEAASDKTNNYPTCLLLAADEAHAKPLNCMADRIATLVPASRSMDPAKNIHLVDMTDNKANHHNPDEEDLRSRVHHGINEGLNEGAKVIVFRNLEALLPADIPLLQLFYSYCDGENPTFPKTLWILTLTTKDLAGLEATAEAKNEPGFIKRTSEKIEKYLEKILEAGKNQVQRTSEQTPHDRDVTRNPLLTRIANYVIPMFSSGRTTGDCV